MEKNPESRKLAVSPCPLERAKSFNWELVDPVVAIPVAQDNKKRNNVKIYADTPY